MIIKKGKKKTEKGLHKIKQRAQMSHFFCSYHQTDIENEVNVCSVQCFPTMCFINTHMR